MIKSIKSKFTKNKAVDILDMIVSEKLVHILEAGEEGRSGGRGYCYCYCISITTITTR